MSRILTTLKLYARMFGCLIFFMFQRKYDADWDRNLNSIMDTGILLDEAAFSARFPIDPVYGKFSGQKMNGSLFPFTEADSLDYIFNYNVNRLIAISRCVVAFLWEGKIVTVWVANRVNCTFHIQTVSTNKEPITLDDLMYCDTHLQKPYHSVFGEVNIPIQHQYRPSFRTMVRFHYHLIETTKTASNVLAGK